MEKVTKLVEYDKSNLNKYQKKLFNLELKKINEIKKSDLKLSGIESSKKSLVWNISRHNPKIFGTILYNRYNKIGYIDKLELINKAKEELNKLLYSSDFNSYYLITEKFDKTQEFHCHFLIDTTKTNKVISSLNKSYNNQLIFHVEKVKDRLNSIFYLLKRVDINDENVYIEYSNRYKKPKNINNPYHIPIEFFKDYYIIYGYEKLKESILKKWNVKEIINTISND